jgi:hypothetical protein
MLSGARSTRRSEIDNRQERFVAGAAFQLLQKHSFET